MLKKSMLPSWCIESPKRPNAAAYESPTSAIGHDLAAVAFNLACDGVLHHAFNLHNPRKIARGSQVRCECARREGGAPIESRKEAEGAKGHAAGEAAGDEPAWLLVAIRNCRRDDAVAAGFDLD